MRGVFKRLKGYILKNLALYIIFFVSGFCGLCYEIVWGREFHLVLGHTTYAISAVLTAFMSGLAIGSALLAGYIDGAKAPAKIYARLEIGIGVFAMAFPFLMNAYKEIFIFAFPYIVSGPAELAFKYISALAMIIVPATLMGATFPVMSKLVVKNFESRGKSAGLIYFLNSLGGAAGCILCGFYMLEEFGSEFTMNIACALNIACGTFMLLFSKAFDGNREARDIHAPLNEAVFSGHVSSGDEALRVADVQKTAVPADARSGVPADGLPDNVSGAAAANSKIVFRLFMFAGFVSMLLEVAWTRVLVLILGSSTYSFSMMLFTFILFLAIGSLAAGTFMDRARRPLAVFGTLELFSAVYILAGISFYDRLPLLFLSMISIGNIPYPLYQLAAFAICAIVMAPPALMAGAAFPAAVSSVRMSFGSRGELAGAGNAIGKLYSYNTLGCVLGSFLTGIFILPAAGLKLTVALGASALFLIASASFFAEAPEIFEKINIHRKTAALVVLLISPAVFFTPEWDRKMLNIGSFYRKTKASAEELRKYNSFQQELFYREGISATVGVSRDKNDGTQDLRINGKVDGSNMKGDMLTQHLIGVLPVLKTASPKSVVVIGMGTGTTLAALCMFKEIEKITCIEISPEVVEAASYFDESYKAYSNDKRVSIVINDARSFMLGSPEKFDVIISEPSNPWIAGIGSLFTEDFFRECKNKLNPGGVMLMWVQTYETSEEIYKLILRTYLGVFKNAELWTNFMGDVYAVSSPSEEPGKELAGEISRYYKKIKDNPGLFPTLKKYGVDNELIFGSLFFMNNIQTRLSAGSGPLNTDAFQSIEFAAPRTLYSQSMVRIDYEAYIYNLERIVRSRIAGLTSDQLRAEISGLVKFWGSEFRPPEIPVSLLDLLISLNVGDDEVFYTKGVLCEKSANYFEAFFEFEKALKMKPDKIEYIRAVARTAYNLSRGRISAGAEKNIAAMISGFKKLTEKDPGDAAAWQALALAYAENGAEANMKTAIRSAMDLLKTPRERLAVLVKCAAILTGKQKIAEAVEIYMFAKKAAASEIEFIEEQIALLKQLQN